jgi:kynurenine formamidase
MPAAVDPISGLELYELSHEWGYYTPIMPGYEDIRIERVSHHARHGAMAQRFATIMHTSTHLNAPIHLVQRATTVGNLPLDRFFGAGVVVAVPKQKWELVSAKDLDAAQPAIKPGDIVVIVTGWHRHYSDSINYFGHAPGLAKDAAEWLVARNAKLVGIDTGTIDHPLATSLGPHRNGPQIRFLPPEYKKATGRNAIDDFPEWNPAHRTLLQAGIPTIENVGGDVAEVIGKRCTFQAYPWKWTEGDACVIRLVAMVDRKGSYRLEPGTAGQ